MQKYSKKFKREIIKLSDEVGMKTESDMKKATHKKASKKY